MLNTAFCLTFNVLFQLKCRTPAMISRTLYLRMAGCEKAWGMMCVCGWVGGSGVWGWGVGGEGERLPACSHKFAQ